MKRPWFLRELAKRVQLQPDAIALEERERRISYGELWRESLRLGGWLAGQGLGPEDLVGLNLPKSIDYVIALLGAWQCGAAFVPLDPALPAGRLQQIRELAGCALVLSELPGAGRPAAFAVFPGPETLAYVIYTSGSTGVPKGVEVTHAGIPGLFRAQIPAFAMNARARSLWLLSIQFDASLSDLGCALLSGATLCIPKGTDVVGEVNRRGITHLDIPPALLRVLQPADLPGVTSMIVGGEASEPAVLRAWAAGRRLVQVYGPTEATICTSLVRVDAGWDSPRLGRAIWGMHHKVRGGELEGGGATPLSTRAYEEGGASRLSTGELCINGPGLARGYRGQPELTAQRFVELEGRRYYRTGDRVRWLGGDCVYLGRLDRQFKHRGRLIEPQEIELQAMGCPGVERAALVWPTLFWSGNVAPGTLQAYLRQRLPEWMLPESWLGLERLPETTSGKVDYGKLSWRVAPADMGLSSLERMQLLMPASLSAESLRGEVARLLPGLPTESASGRGGGVLFTGATGFLGSHLLPLLLERGPVYCVARRAEDLPALPGIRPVVADLGDPNWDAALPEDVATIYHLAARVNVVASFAELRSVNLDSLVGLARYLARGPRKHLHYASTLSVLVGTDRNAGLLREDDDLSSIARVYGGYAQSKWAAEWFLRQLPASLCDLTLYRYGLLTAHTQTGMAAPTDFLRLFGRGLLALGAYPRGAEIFTDITPVDFAAASTLAARGGTIHVANPRSAGLHEIVAALGEPLREVDPREFFALVPPNPEAAAAQRALCRYSPDFEKLRSLDLFQATGVRIQTERLVAAGLLCPEPTLQYLKLAVRTPGKTRKDVTTPESGRPGGESSRG